MTKSNIKAVIQGDIQRVWKIVTAVEDYTWRSDLSRTEILSEKQFIEYTRTGYATTFTVTVLEPCKRWEFEMENTNMKGRWIGVFTSVEEGTEIDFTECVTVPLIDKGILASSGLVSAFSASSSIGVRPVRLIPFP